MLAKIIVVIVIFVTKAVESGLYSHVIGAPVNVVSGGIANPFFSNALDLFRGADFRRRCPVCDPSVYSYCTDKLFHDSCCCHNPNNPYDQLPYQCSYADCSFLHANTCAEHKLITACCCINQ